MPANTPGPTIATSKSAQISELIEREETMIKSAIGRTKRRWAWCCAPRRRRPAQRITIAMAVPRVAMLMVSHRGNQSFSM